MTDSLMQAYYQWTSQNEIPNTAEYAQTGLLLAAEFRAMGRVSMAASCQSRAEQYQQLAALIPAIKRVPMGKSFVMLESLEVQDEPIHQH